MVLAGLDDALQRRDEQIFCQRVREAFSMLQSILATWTADLALHAQGLEHHHASLYKAAIAVGGLKVKDAELEVGINDIQPRLGNVERELSLIRQTAAGPTQQPAATVQLAELEAKVVEMRNHIVQEEDKTKKLVEEIRNKVLSVESKSRSDLDSLAHLVDTKVKAMDDVDGVIQAAVVKNFETVTFGEQVVKAVAQEVQGQAQKLDALRAEMLQTHQQMEGAATQLDAWRHDHL